MFKKVPRHFYAAYRRGRHGQRLGTIFNPYDSSGDRGWPLVWAKWWEDGYEDQAAGREDRHTGQLELFQRVA